jgi:hypothetical protein
MVNGLWSKVNPFSSRRSQPAQVVPLQRPNLTVLAQQPAQLPDFVRACPVAQKYLKLLGDLDWANFPERPSNRPWPGSAPQPRAPYVAAYLVKLQEEKRYMSQVRTFLIEHPALVWLLGFKLQPDPTAPYGFDVAASVPSRKQLGRVLRDLPNEAAQFLLSCTVKLLQAELPPELGFGQEISLDTRVVQAWVKENNPKAYVKESERLDKTRQPKGDRTCKLGCKKKANRPPQEETDPSQETTPQPSRSQKKVKTNFSPGDVYFWGYGSGVVATKVPDWGEFVLADLTQPFNESDFSFFLPLMQRAQAALGFKPPYGALDAAFDVWVVYDYFHEAGGFGAVPLVERGLKDPQFAPDGLPLCQAGLPMPIKSAFLNRRGLVPQPQAHFGCPLLYPAPIAPTCPCDHPHWPKGGCKLTMGTTPGARLRYQLDREGAEYQRVYNQRTATERINALAGDLGIEHPKLRNGRAIANQNTLTYVLLNLRALQRLRAKKAKAASA